MRLLSHVTRRVVSTASDEAWRHPTRLVRRARHRVAAGRACAIALCALCTTTVPAWADTPAAVDSPGPDVRIVPAKTPIAFHFLQSLSSATTVPGSHFAFVLVAPMRVGGAVVAETGSVGSGTVLVSGPAGNQGHEGDLTLRLDILYGGDDEIVFQDERGVGRGKERKLLSAVLGLPGIFVHGSDLVIDPATVISAMLDHPATIRPIAGETTP